MSSLANQADSHSLIKYYVLTKRLEDATFKHGQQLYWKAAQKSVLLFWPLSLLFLFFGFELNCITFWFWMIK